MALGPAPAFPALFILMKRRKDQKNIRNLYKQRDKLLGLADNFCRNSEKCTARGDDASASSWLRLVESIRFEARFVEKQADILSEVLNPQKVSTPCA
ncbi:hypothetical protein ACE4RV_06230 [Acetobacter persici]|uniref:hypothetical protein n=1 Tax=Acetobacter persici TaxID=1076596 RepID=UPI0036DE648F